MYFNKFASYITGITTNNTPDKFTFTLDYKYTKVCKLLQLWDSDPHLLSVLVRYFQTFLFIVIRTYAIPTYQSYSAFMFLTAIYEGLRFLNVITLVKGFGIIPIDYLDQGQFHMQSNRLEYNHNKHSFSLHCVTL